MYLGGKLIYEWLSKLTLQTFLLNLVYLICQNNVILGGSVVASAGSNTEFESVTFRNNIALDHEKGTSIFVEDNSNLYIGEKVCLQENLFGGEGMVCLNLLFL